MDTLDDDKFFALSVSFSAVHYFYQHVYFCHGFPFPVISPIHVSLPLPVIRCLSAVPEVNNTEVHQDGDTYGSEVVYACAEGHTFPDHATRKTIHCQLDHTWSAAPPGCESEWGIKNIN